VDEDVECVKSRHGMNGHHLSRSAMAAVAESSPWLEPNSTSGMEAMRDLRREEDVSSCCICCAAGGGSGDLVVETVPGASCTDIIDGIVNTCF